MIAYCTCAHVDCQTRISYDTYKEYHPRYCKEHEQAMEDRLLKEHCDICRIYDEVMIANNEQRKESKQAKLVG
jgi:hypothetical protein